MAKKFFNRQAKLFKEARAKAEITQTALAKTLGIKPQYVSQVERGVQGVPLKKWVTVCKILNLNTEKMARAITNDFGDRIRHYGD